MPDINKAQQEALSSGLLDRVGAGRDSFPPVSLEITAKVLAQYGAEFALEVAEKIRQRQVVGSGALADSAVPQIVQRPGSTVLQLKILDYFDYPNEGVKGVKSSKNAPGSPYQYKNFGMSPEGRKSIMKYISEGKAKVSNVRNDKALGIGLERKGAGFKPKKSLIERQTDSLIYMIKAFGIKKTNYFNDAFKEVFKDFEIVMSEAVGRDIIFQLEKINRK